MYMNGAGAKDTADREVVGILPAGGLATRIAPLPCSKELFPVGFRKVDADGGLRPKVICHYLLEKMKFAGVDKAFVVLRSGKWDIPSYLGDGNLMNLHLAYLIMGLPFGAPYTIDQAYPFVRDAMVVFGFPDILFQPGDAFVRLLARQAQTRADMVVGLYKTTQPSKMDMVEIADDGRILDFVIKPTQTRLQYTWIIAAWTPAFTGFMHEFLKRSAATIEIGQESSGPDHQESYVGNVIQAAIEHGLFVDSVTFSDSPYIDIGTPEDLSKVVDQIHKF